MTLLSEPPGLWPQLRLLPASSAGTQVRPVLGCRLASPGRISRPSGLHVSDSGSTSFPLTQLSAFLPLKPKISTSHLCTRWKKMLIWFLPKSSLFFSPESQFSLS